MLKQFLAVGSLLAIAATITVLATRSAVGVPTTTLPPTTVTRTVVQAVRRVSTTTTTHTYLQPVTHTYVQTETATVTKATIGPPLPSADGGGHFNPNCPTGKHWVVAGQLCMKDLK